MDGKENSKTSEEFLRLKSIGPEHSFPDDNEGLWTLEDLLTDFAKQSCKERIEHAKNANAELINEVSRQRDEIKANELLIAAILTACDKGETMSDFAEAAESIRAIITKLNKDDESKTD